MKSKKSSLRAALFLALIGAAFAFTACWQGTPAGGSNMPGSSGNVTSGDNKPGDTNSKNNNSKDNGSKNADGNKSGDTDSKDNNPKDSGGGENSGGGNTASSIEGSWKANGGQLVLHLKSGKVTYTGTVTSTVGGEVSDSGRYTITGATITFTGFTNPGVKVLFNREFKYEIKGDTLTLLDGATNTPMFIFKKA